MSKAELILFENRTNMTRRFGRPFTKKKEIRALTHWNPTLQKNVPLEGVPFRVKTCAGVYCPQECPKTSEKTPYKWDGSDHMCKRSDPVVLPPA
jgi:hypothetical protein